MPPLAVGSCLRGASWVCSTRGWEILGLTPAWSLRRGREGSGLCSPSLHSFLFQDKYLADMDELFSQVDEKRKVSVPQLPALPSPNCLP